MLGSILTRYRFARPKPAGRSYTISAIWRGAGAYHKGTWIDVDSQIRNWC